MATLSLRCIEWFAGTGGLHCALAMAVKEMPNVEYQVVGAYDINQEAEVTYRHNFSDVPFYRKSIDNLSVTQIDHTANLWVLSPPCQPFVLNGRGVDIEDVRNAALLRILSLLDELSNEEQPHFFFLENVVGFSTSQTHELCVSKLQGHGYHVRGVSLTPCAFGIPNDRSRFYLLASKSSLPNDISFESDSLPTMEPISKFIDTTVDILDERYKVNQDAMRTLAERGTKFDIVFLDSITSSSFTKSYRSKSTHFRGNGSLLCTNASSKTYDRFLNNIEDLDIRYFTPEEILRIHFYPSSWTFPSTVSLKHRYALLGNGVNIFVCAKLLTVLISESTVSTGDGES
eukprot:GILJ01009790.1.p1 GENE.GILJ01009790.1~~GILJ01009790.1.p1  ORF type:complete len:344 (+),score=36.55 GILJ01009790.1:45-1076(+)